MTRRLSLCYAAPGHALLSSSGPTRNILSLARALSHWVDVTVAFRKVLEPTHAEKYQVITIEPCVANVTEYKDDDATRGLNPLSHLAYLRTLHTFARQWAGSYDLVLEKGWRLSGFLSAAFRLQGVPGVLVENDVHYWSEPAWNSRIPLKYLLHRSAQSLAGFCSRRVPMIIAETEELKAMLVKQRHVLPESVAVIGLGVDHSLFYPVEQASARQPLGIDSAVTVLLYVGGMDQYHDLGPILDALTQMQLPALELHFVGDGEYRPQYEAQASRAQVPVRFHGLVPHSLIPAYIAAADLCIAPYRTSAFHHAVVPFSTLKIPEYMACGRPVVSIASGNIQRLIEDQVSGFLFPNDVCSWVSFLKVLPSRAQLSGMGQAAARAVESLSWENTAAQYWQVCQRLTV